MDSFKERKWASQDASSRDRDAFPLIRKRDGETVRSLPPKLTTAQIKIDEDAKAVDVRGFSWML